MLGSFRLRRRAPILPRPNQQGLARGRALAALTHVVARFLRRSAVHTVKDMAVVGANLQVDLLRGSARLAFVSSWRDSHRRPVDLLALRREYLGHPGGMDQVPPQVVAQDLAGDQECYQRRRGPGVMDGSATPSWAPEADRAQPAMAWLFATLDAHHGRAGLVVDQMQAPALLMCTQPGERHADDPRWIVLQEEVQIHP